MIRHNFGVQKTIKLHDRCSSHHIQNTPLIVINVNMTFFLHWAVFLDGVNGVLIVRIKYYAKTLLVSHVMTSLSLHMRKHNFGVLKTRKLHDRYLNHQTRNIFLIVTSVYITLHLY